MQFRAELTPKTFAEKIKHTDKLLLIGSCFTAHIGKKLLLHKFRVQENPNGILFNPVSIAKSITSYVEGKTYDPGELFFHNELWASRDHHSQFSNPDAAEALEKINDSQRAASEFIRSADWVIITLGSAFLYEWKDIAAEGSYSNVAANCHKIPTDKFNRRLAGVNEVTMVLHRMIDTVRSVNPNAKFVFTISPVRHLREGFIENNQSKATLIIAIQQLISEPGCFYFPSYELIIDDLRDYRFYAEDLVHPNYAATEYVWEKFVHAAFDEKTAEALKKIREINIAKNHKPFNSASAAHKDFLAAQLKRVAELQAAYPYLDLKEEEKYFSSLK